MKPFEQRYADALADENIASGLLEFQRGWREGRDAQITALEESEGRSFGELRRELAGIKDGVRADWEAYIEEFASNARAAGTTVTRVATPEEANRFIVELCTARGIELATKGKSMVSEEIGLNVAFERAGITPVETDLGEWILQLAGEHPSHLVMPAIHKRKEQIAALFERVLDREFPPDDIPRMVHVARTELRARFLASGVGLSGANALVAEGGSVMLVCNEGNNRMSVALPNLHVVIAGAEKIVPTYADALKQVRLLARSATGQPITVYTNFVTGPRPGQEQHIVLVDNGRAAMGADPDIASALRCIRCGACANVCPPYAVVGGHAFGYVYTGAIGLVNTLWHHGVDAAAGPQSLCVSCGACATVCPVEIPLPTQILETRHRVMEARPHSSDARTRRIAMRAFASRRVFGGATRAAGALARPFARDGLARLPRPLAQLPAVASRTSWRTPPAPAVTPARDRLRPGRQPDVPYLGETAATGRTVLLFLQCLSDRIAPDIAISAARLLRAAGAHVVVRRQQHCCGLPAFDTGQWDSATKMVHQTMDALDGVDDIVTAAPSCVAMLVHEAPRLVRDDPHAAERLRRLGARTHDLIDYLVGPARLPAGSLDNGDSSAVTVHRFCQSTNTLGRRDEMERLVRDLACAPVIPLAEATECCGFGGSTSVVNPEVAEHILRRKLGNVDDTGARVLVSDNPGCLMHLRGGVDATDRTIDVRHIAEYLASRLPARETSARDQ